MAKGDKSGEGGGGLSNTPKVSRFANRVVESIRQQPRTNQLTLTSCFKNEEGSCYRCLTGVDFRF